ncbi:LacI family DNA-binding transcriptional regulator [Tabrizicola sp.]|uniref:LacI family DNA-binding transcriptional regulator n=1 Tax=Tabrizicola sp. TaxID=2005166 RepID=UPI00286A1AD9|nr:LacI family DNA-binding transcriptional regulator [Tabrizicola sp.]
MRPTVNDIAREAGVSLATVDRVLNERPGVRDKTIRAVNDAIAKLGYVRNVAAANLARQRRYRFLFILPAVETQFLRALQAAIHDAARGPLAEASDVVIATVPQRDPHAIVTVLDDHGDQPIDGCAIMAHETPDVRDLIIRLKAEGTTVVTLITDQPRAPRDHFVGIDNRAAGRTAAVLLGRFAGQKPGKVAVVVSSMLARDMVDRRLGFDEVLAERFPHLQSLPSLEGHDDRDLTAQITAACLAAHDNVVAIYVAGAGTRGVNEAVRRAGLPDHLVVVAHELTAHTRGGLEDGSIDAVIAQDVGHLARSALRVLRAKADRAPLDEGQEQIRIEIVIRENLPPSTDSALSTPQAAA